MVAAPSNNLPSLSVVIPCWNDDHALRTLLTSLASVSGIEEIIVADATAGPESEMTAQALGAKIVKCPTPNRGRQLNAGAALAHGDLLLFQHADSELTQGHVDALLSALTDPAIAGGAFHRRFDTRHPLLRCLESAARLLSRWGGTLFGDQSIFVRRDHFQRLGGFADIPLMEDVDFSARLRRSGTTVVLDPPLASSPRRHLRGGAWKTTLKNGLLIILFKLGASPEMLHQWYYCRPPNLREPG